MVNRRGKRSVIDVHTHMLNDKWLELIFMTVTAGSLTLRMTQ